MAKSKKTILWTIAVFVIIIAAIFVLLHKPVLISPNQTASTSAISQTTTDNNVPVTTIKATTTLANPASVNCEQQGGQLQMATRPDGGQYGLCYFEDNRACEEWAMMRGDCPVGGMKTTGYDTDAQKYCAWSGGQTVATPNAVCTFKDGSTCADDAFYAGTCQPGEKIK
jgi:putative hemolysin